jgi:hypothetical protein
MKSGLKKLLLLGLWSWPLASWTLAAFAQAPDWDARVYKLVATQADGTTELGSAVPLGGERLVTNCHVLRQAVRIEVHVDGAAMRAETDRRDTYRDMCFVTLPGLAAPPMPMIEVGETRVGLDVVAAGWPGGALAVSRGRIIGLHHCECDGGKVIQTSAAFDRGASGGGLFDRQGRLVGILTFKAKAGGNFHFALPVGWLRHTAMDAPQPLSSRLPGHPKNDLAPSGSGSAGFAEPGAPLTDTPAFWEKPGRESGYFLAACDLGAQKKWLSLQRLGQEWTRQEPDNPEAWMALGRADLGMGQAERAVAAFQRVLMLDSTHAEAGWALRELEFDLDRTIGEPDSL